MLNFLMRIILSLLLLIPGGALAATLHLPETGQAGCWDIEGDPVACTGTGQDGEKRAGVAWPESPRFTDNEDGTLTDRLTGLIWLKNANCFNDITWPMALFNAKTLAAGFCGLSDGSTAGKWRLPNRTELLSIVNYQQSSGAVWLNSQGFTGGVNSWYWTSDSSVLQPARKWVVHSTGEAAPDNEGAVNYALFVRGLAAVALAPATHDFGTVILNNNSAPQTFTITNTGAARLIVNDISIGGSDSSMFTIDPGNGSAGTCGSLKPSLATGAGCTVSVIFTPTSGGAKTATLRVASNADNLPTAESVLSGAGTPTCNISTVVSPGGSGSITCSPGTAVTYNTAVSCTVTPNTGYKISSVAVDDAPQTITDPFSFTHSFGSVKTSHSMAADFSVITYTLTFTVNGSGTIDGPANQTVIYNGNSAEVTAYADPGYHFVNWTGSDGFTSTANPLIISGVLSNRTITANFAANQADTFTVNFVAGAHGSTSSPASQTVARGGSTTAVTAIGDPGYHFVNWTGPDGFTSIENPLTVTNVTSDLTINAVFAANASEAPFTVNFTHDGNGTTTGPASQTVDSGGSTAYVTAVPAPGYHFVNWTGPDGFTSTANPLKIDNVTADLTITAHFEPNPAGTFTVTFRADTHGGTTTGPASQLVGSGAGTTAVTAIPGPGYHFVNWTGPDGFTSTDNPLTITNVTGNMEIRANFEADTMADAFKAFLYILGKSELTDLEKLSYDVAPLNAEYKPKPNGKVDAADVVIMLRRLVGLLDW